MYHKVKGESLRKIMNFEPVNAQVTLHLTYFNVLVSNVTDVCVEKHFGEIPFMQLVFENVKVINERNIFEGI